MIAAFDPALPSVFDVLPGEVGVTSRSVGELSVTLPGLGDAETPLDDTDYTYEVGVAERRVLARFSPRRAILGSVAHAASALARTPAGAAWLSAGSLDSVRHIYDRVNTSTACSPTASGSVSAARSVGRESGTGSRRTSWRAMCSAKAPGYWLE